MEILETRKKIIDALARYAESNTDPDGVLLNHKSADYANETGWVYVGFPQSIGSATLTSTITVHLPDYMWEDYNPVLVTLLELVLL